MNIFLCSCPSTDPALPPGGISALGAHLQQQNISCELFDLNLLFFLNLLNESEIKKALYNVEQRWLKKEFMFGQGKEVEQVLEYTKQLLPNIDEIINLFREEEQFFDAKKFFKVKHDLKILFNLYSLQYKNIKIDKFSLFTSPYDSYDEIITAIHHPDAQFIKDFYKRLFLPHIKNKQPKIVGISVAYFSQLVPSFILADTIKETYPEIHIILGGPVIAWGKEILIQEAVNFSKLFDSFCVSEGEACVCELVNHIIKGVDISTVPDLIYYENEIAVQTAPSIPINLNDLQTPLFKKLPLGKYLAPYRIISLPITKGCYYNQCEFCNYSFIKSTKYRERSVDLVISDIQEIISSTGERIFCFESDVISPYYLKKLSKELINNKINIKWHACMRFEKSVTQSLFDLLSKAGCVRLYLGLESGSQTVLDKMKKGTDINTIERILDYCHKAKIAVEAGIFLGYPDETIDDANKTIRFIQRNQNKITRADPGFFRMLKGAPIEIKRRSFYKKTKTNFGYVIDVANTYLDQHRSEYQCLYEKILAMYPLLELMDVSEDILYTAKLDPLSMRQISTMIASKSCRISNM